MLTFRCVKTSSVLWLRHAHIGRWAVVMVPSDDLAGRTFNLGIGRALPIFRGAQVFYA